MNTSATLVSIFLFIASYSTLSAQEQWEFINRKPQIHDLTDVILLSQHRAIAVGQLGTIRLTEDRGASFTYPESPTLAWLQSIAFFDSTIGIACGNAGSIIQTGDAGRTWTSVASPTSHTLYGLATDSKETAVAVGVNGTVLVSSNHGTSWEARSSGTTDSLFSVVGSEDGTFIAAGKSGTVIRSTDRGMTWNRIESGIQADLKSVAIAEGQWWVAGFHGALYRSENNGETWARVPSSDSVFRYANIQFFSEEHGVRSGYTNSEWNAAFKIEFTEDGGKSWSVPSGLNVLLRSEVSVVGPAISFLNKDVGMSAGIDGSMKRYERGGIQNTFTSTTLTGYTTWEWTDIHCSTPLNCVVVGVKNEYGNGDYQSIIEWTTDGGETWQEVQHTLHSGRSSPPRTPVVRSVYSFDDRTAIVVGDSGIYLRTTGTHQTERVHLNLDLPHPWHFDLLSFVDDQYGMMKSGGDVILTKDSGKTWENKNISPLYGLETPWIVDRNTLFVISPFNFYHSTDFGESWNQDDYRDDASEAAVFADITFTDTETGWLMATHQVNNQGQRQNTVLLHTTDAGATWTTKIDEELVGAEFGMRAIDFADPQHGMMMGTQNAAYYTSDFGETWNPIELPLEHSVVATLGFLTTGIAFPTKDRAIAVSKNGEMLRYNGTTSSVEAEEATSLDPVWLWLMVPNPAKDNVSMTVSWFPSINSKEITLKVYDLTGREVQDLTPILRTISTTNNRAKVRFDIQELSEGTYIVSASGKGYVKSRLLQVVR